MKADNGNQQFWGRWSGSYDGFMGSNSSLYEEMALRMKRRLSRQMCVLELACGTGLISQRLAGSVKSLEATDYAPGNDCRGKEKGTFCPAALQCSECDLLALCARFF